MVYWASQAEEAGSIPVPCSKKKKRLMALFLFGYGPYIVS